jgi:hydrogenase maturation protease
VICVGNRFRRDDGAGLEAAARLRPVLTSDTRLVVCEGNVVALLDDWREAQDVVIIDATSSGRAPGTIQTFDPHTGPLPATFSRSSTHAFDVAQALELARALGRLPPRVIVYGIEGVDFAPGEGLSSCVDAAVSDVVSRLATRP